MCRKTGNSAKKRLETLMFLNSGIPRQSHMESFLHRWSGILEKKTFRATNVMEIPSSECNTDSGDTSGLQAERMQQSIVVVYMRFEGPISSPKRTVLAHQDCSGRNSRTNVGTGLSICAKARRISRSKKRRCAMFCGSVLRSSTSVLAVSFSASHSRFLTTILERSVPEVPEMFARPCLRLCEG